MNLWDLEPGAKIQLEGDVVGQIVSPTEDGQWVLVRYIEAPQEPDLINTEDLCSADEIVSVSSP